MKSRSPLLAAILTAGILRAASSMTSSTAGAGGMQSAGAIIIHSSVDAGGIASASSTTVKSGFAGQLYDVKALTISMASTNVNEGTAFIPSVAATLDDDTALATANSTIAWSWSGPLSSVFPGVFVAQALYTGTLASVVGTYLGATGSLGLLVPDSSPDNYFTSPYDFSGDGLADWWQMAHFGAGSTNAAPTADPDGDGSANFAEFLFDTGPASASSTPSNAITPVMVADAGQTYFAASLYRRGALPGSMGFAPQIIGDLSTTAWTNTPVVFSTSTTNGAGMVTEIWRDTQAATNSAERFLRVQVYGIED